VAGSPRTPTRKGSRCARRRIDRSGQVTIRNAQRSATSRHGRGVPLALWHPDRLQCWRTSFGTERLSPSARERVPLAEGFDMTRTGGPWISVDGSEMQAFQLAAMADALTLSFKAKAAVGLFAVRMREPSLVREEGYLERPEGQGNRGSCRKESSLSRVRW